MTPASSLLFPSMHPGSKIPGIEPMRGGCQAEPDRREARAGRWRYALPWEVKAHRSQGGRDARSSPRDGTYIVWVRHFDPSAWPHGLSDRWTVVDLEDPNTRVIEISGPGVVHDMRDSGRELVILSSVFPAQGEAEVRVSTFGHFIRPPQQSAGLEAASNDRTRTEQGTPSGSESGGLEL